MTLLIDITWNHDAAKDTPGTNWVNKIIEFFHKLPSELTFRIKKTLLIDACPFKKSDPLWSEIIFERVKVLKFEKGARLISVRLKNIEAS